MLNTPSGPIKKRTERERLSLFLGLQEQVQHKETRRTKNTEERSFPFSPIGLRFNPEVRLQLIASTINAKHRLIGSDGIQRLTLSRPPFEPRRANRYSHGKCGCCRC